jgi:PleD family two-component response regulator
MEDINSRNQHNKNKSILVLDDEPDILTIVEQSLQGLGFRVSARVFKTQLVFTSAVLYQLLLYFFPWLVLLQLLLCKRLAPIHMSYQLHQHLRLFH